VLAGVLGRLRKSALAALFFRDACCVRRQVKRVLAEAAAHSLRVKIAAVG